MDIRIGYPNIKCSGQPVLKMSDDCLLETWHTLRNVPYRRTTEEPTPTEVYLHDVQKEIERRLELRKHLDKLYDMIYGMDIPSPTVPEYVEWHENCTKLLNYLEGLNGSEEN